MSDVKWVVLHFDFLILFFFCLFFVFSPFVFVNVAHNEKIVKRFKIELTNKLDLFYDFESDY